MLRRQISTVFTSLLLLFCVAASPAFAQTERSILVLDGSGSMWGQIDGVAKINIAQRVIGELLDTLPETQELGLSVYGHRRKGDCGDIELVVPPAAGTRDAIRAAVNAVSPKGKTPLSAAVIAAAEALKYEENAATVILISDGRETCELDPCEVGRRLEQTGVGFTAHVIGFDVSSPEDRAQLQCLAENTGGRFLNASNASELSKALEEVSATPPPAPAPVAIDMIFLATDGEGGPAIRDGLLWTLTDLDSGKASLSDFDVPDLRLALTPGRYRAEVLRPGDGQRAGMEVTVSDGGPHEVVLVLKSTVPDAAVQGPATAVAGSTIAVTWTGPDAKNDYISVATPDSKGSGQVNYTYTNEGSPLKLLMPPEPGKYQLRYILSDGRVVLASADIDVTPVTATLAAPESADAGSTIVVDWTGPDYKNDYISVAKPDQQGSQQVNYTYTNEGGSLKLEMPPEPGTYEIRYIMSQGRTVLASRTIEVTSVGATLSAPEEAVVGSVVTVEWTGPDYKNDYISVAKPDQQGSQQVNYTYTKDGSPLKLEMPPEPGTYEIRYIISQGRVVLASRMVKITDAAVTLDAPDTAEAGSTIVVGWAGPDEKNDYISVAKPDQQGSQQANYTYTKDGSPLKLVMPPEPGTYEIRYILSQSRRIMASRTINVTAVEGRIEAPDTAAAGSTVTVEWAGPDYKNDYISVAKPDQQGSQQVNYTYTKEGSPLKLVMPPEPGTYEIRYIISQGRKVLASRTITVNDVTASVTAPASAPAGSDIVVEWTGPDYKNDYISVAQSDQPGSQQANYTYTNKGSPLKLRMPDKPGDYEIRYILSQSRRILTSMKVTVTAP